MDNKWRNWCRTNLGLETAPIKNFLSKARFVSLGSYCALPSIAGKLQIEVTLHGARDLPIFAWPVVAANGLIVLCMVGFCYLELFMPHALIPDACNKQLEERDFRTCPSECSETHDWLWYFRLRRRSTSVTKPWIPWRSRSFRLDEDQVRSRDLEQLKWLYRMTHTKIKVEAFSLIHYLKQDHWTMRTIRFSLLSTNRVCLTLWGDPFGGDGVPGDLENLWNISKTHEPLCEQQCDQFCTKPDLRMCLCWQRRCCMTMQDFFHAEMPFTRHCGTRIFPMSWGGSHWHHDFDDDEAWKVWKSMESCGAAWAGSSDWANHLQSQVKKTMERRKERFLSESEAAWQETNTCKYSRWIPIVFVLPLFGANPLHCLYFSQNIKRQRENLRLTQNRWQKILASHLPAMPRKTLFSFVPLLGFVRFQGLRSCNAYNLWFRMPPAKSNRPTCLRWIPQRSCWRFLTCSKRWNDALVARMWDYWCW